ncbi:hypothetical protein [Saccharospirillum salsuginis]|uniref:Uncharacterized protein n=1 Tax=Saccharospirillum salsuginis TaxID=418750 RepID=A0A918K7K4_9GAMM|nr:hypothetical protein [Saccharospirillum salsuginis]GGX52554.1 hypothetical protein GCM10007392_19900 [Saccharospirillum salsuginis]
MRMISVAQPGHPEGNNAEHQRELILEKLTPGRKRLSLMLPDTQHEFHKIPLGFGETVAFDADLGEPPADLVPVTFLRQIPDEGLGPLRDGWVYVFVNGYLWREVRFSLEGHQLRDVHLGWEKGLDKRRASGQANDVMILPWKLDHAECTVQLAFSEEQWSWDRIDQLGGMNPEDPRQKQGERFESAYDTDFSKQQRLDRLVTLDLSAVEDDFQSVPEDSPIRSVEPGELAHTRQHYNTHFDKGVASVILPDRLGEARYAAESHHEYLTLLQAVVDEMLGVAPDSAPKTLDEQNALAERKLAALFADQLFAGADRKLRDGPVSDAEKAAIDKRIEARELLDRDALETALEKDGCRQLLDDALNERLTLMALLDDPAFYAELLDLHTLSNPGYVKFFETVGRLIRHFNMPITQPYKDGFLDLAEQEQLQAQDPGPDFLLRLTGAHPEEKPHKLHALLFPQAPDGDPGHANPLVWDTTEPDEEEHRLSPAKVEELFKDLHFDAGQDLQHDGKAFKASLYAAHAFNTLLEPLAVVVHKDVRGVQGTEQDRGETSHQKQQKQDAFDAAVNRRRDLIQENRQHHRDYQASLDRTRESAQQRDQLMDERQRLLGNTTPDELRRNNRVAAARVDRLEERIAELDQQLEMETENQGRLTAKKAHVGRSLEAMESRIETLQKIGDDTGPFSLFQRARFNPNTAPVRLYALIAGEQLESLSISHDDWMHGRTPAGILPPGHQARMARLTRIRDIAERIETHRGPRVEFELPNEKTIRVPADLALEDTAKLHEYLAHYARQTMDTAESKQAEKIVQIGLRRDANVRARNQTQLTMVAHDQRATMAEIMDEAIAKADAELVENREGLFMYEQNFYASRQALRDNAQFMATTRQTIADLNAHLATLDETQTRVRFENRLKGMILGGRAMGVLEAFNVTNALAKVSYENKRSLADAFSAIVDLTATILGAFNVVHEGKYGDVKTIRARLKNRALEAYVKTFPVDEKILEKASKLAKASKGFNLASGALGSALSALDAYDRWLMGDRDAAMAHGLIASGFMLTAVSVFTDATIGIFTVSTLGVFAGFSIVVGGIIWSVFAEDTPLEQLLNNSPFAVDRTKAFSADRADTQEAMARWGLLTPNTFEHWRLQKQWAFHEAATHFFHPRVHFFKDSFVRDFFEINIQTPSLESSGDWKRDIQIRILPDEHWHSLALTTGAGNWKQEAKPGQVKIKSAGERHRILIHRDLIKAYVPDTALSGAHLSVMVRIRVQSWPFGEDNGVLPGSEVPYVLPAPMRNAEGQPLVDDKVVSEQEAAEQSWLIAEGEITLIKDLTWN